MERDRVRRMRRCDCKSLEIYDGPPSDLAERYAESTLDVIDGDLNFWE